MMRRYFHELSVAALLGVLLLSLLLFAPSFYAPAPLLSRLASQMPPLIAAVGMTLVIVSRQIDISVGSQFGICAVTAGLLARLGVPLPMIAIGSVGAGALMGAINGILVAGLRLPSIVVTLATMVTWQEGLRLWQQGKLLNLPPGVQWFGLGQQSGQITIIGFAVALTVSALWTMTRVTAGRLVYAVGSNPEAARLAGISPGRVTFAVFTVLGALVGLGAMMHAVQSPQIQPTSGEGLELKVIASCVVGGVAVTGGRGSILGVFPGLLLLANVNPALTHFQIHAYWEKAIQGLVILLAVGADHLRERKQPIHAR